jgi:hypothetical protein
MATPTHLFKRSNNLRCRGRLKQGGFGHFGHMHGYVAGLAGSVFLPEGRTGLAPGFSSDLVAGTAFDQAL